MLKYVGNQLRERGEPTWKLRSKPILDPRGLLGFIWLVRAVEVATGRDQKKSNLPLSQVPGKKWQTPGIELTGGGVPFGFPFKPQT